MARKLKTWNGMLFFSKDNKGNQLEYNRMQRSAYVCAYSQKDALVLLEEFGHPTSLYEFRGWWSDRWGNTMAGVERERGLWVDFGEGPVRLLEKIR